MHESLHIRYNTVACLCRNCEILFQCMFGVFTHPDKRIGVGVKPFELGRIRPCVLDEFKLFGDIGVEASKQQAHLASGFVIFGRADEIFTIRPNPPHDAVTPGEHQ